MNRIIKISIFIFVFNIIYSEEYAGYLREIDMSFCMDDCSHFYLESEEGEYISNISFNASLRDLQTLTFISGIIFFNSSAQLSTSSGIASI